MNLKALYAVADAAQKEEFESTQALSSEIISQKWQQAVLELRELFPSLFWNVEEEIEFILCPNSTVGIRVYDYVLWASTSNFVKRIWLSNYLVSGVVLEESSQRVSYEVRPMMSEASHAVNLKNLIGKLNS